MRKYYYRVSASDYRDPWISFSIAAYLLYSRCKCSKFSRIAESKLGIRGNVTD